MPSELACPWCGARVVDMTTHEDPEPNYACLTGHRFRLSDVPDTPPPDELAPDGRPLIVLV
jgi:hypothetical protein